MKFLKKLFAGIANFFESRPDESVEPLLPPINEDEIRERLEVVSKAHEHGAAGVPAPDQVQQSPVEYKILAELGAIRSMGFKYGEHRKILIQRALDKVQLTRDANRMAQLGDEFVRESDRILSVETAKLKISGEQLRARKALLDNFRAENKLPDTDAALPGRNKRSQRWAILILAVIFEGVCNAFWFATGMADGLMGGFMLALGFSFFNVLVCFIAGRLFTNSNHVRWIRRALGWFSGAGGLAFTVVVGFVVAYFRYALSVLEDGTQSAVSLSLDAWRTGLSPFVDFQSIMLFGATVAFGVLALWHAYHWTDTYPGYAKVFRAYKDAFLLNAKALANLRRKLDDEKSSKLAQLETDIKSAEDRIHRFKSYMNEKSVVEKNVVAYTVKAENTLRSLIQRYRYENQLKRPADCPRPAYFDAAVQFEDDNMPSFSIADDLARLDEQEQLLREMNAIFQPTRDKIQAAYTQKFSLIQPLESQV